MKQTGKAQFIINLSNGDHHILTPPLEMGSNTVFVNADNLRQRYDEWAHNRFEHVPTCMA